MLQYYKRFRFLTCLSTRLATAKGLRVICGRPCKNLPHVWFDHAKFGSHTVCMHVGGPKNLEAGPYPLGRGLSSLRNMPLPPHVLA